MLHRTVWDAPSASSKQKLVLNQENGQKKLHRTVWDAPSAIDKEVSFRLETGVENVSSNCMGRAVRRVEKEESQF